MKAAGACSYMGSFTNGWVWLAAVRLLPRIRGCCICAASSPSRSWSHAASSPSRSWSHAAGDYRIQSAPRPEASPPGEPCSDEFYLLCLSCCYGLPVTAVLSCRIRSCTTLTIFSHCTCCCSFSVGDPGVHQCQALQDLRQLRVTTGCSVPAEGQQVGALPCLLWEASRGRC